MRIKLPNKKLKGWQVLTGTFVLALSLAGVAICSSNTHLVDLLSIAVTFIFVGGISWAVAINAVRLVSSVDYTYLNFTDTEVILGHKDPLFIRRLPYESTALSLRALTKSSSAYHNAVKEHISHLFVSFAGPKETVVLEFLLSGVNVKLQQRLLQNSWRFKNFDLLVAPEKDTTDPKQLEATDKIRQQLQTYVDRIRRQAPRW